MTQFRVKQDRIVRGETWAAAGQVVYTAKGYDYGLARDDTYATGVEHISVTFKADGDWPSFTIPRQDLEAL